MSSCASICTDQARLIHDEIQGWLRQHRRGNDSIGMTSMANVAESTVQSRSSIPQETLPLFVGIQGPQGIGKSTVMKEVLEMLRRNDVQATGFSLDDVYLKGTEQDSLSTKAPWLSSSRRDDAASASPNGGSILFQQRGNPGTHDLSLAVNIMETLRLGNHYALAGIQQHEAPECEPCLLQYDAVGWHLRLPKYDKLCRQGRGDRVTDGGMLARFPLDVVLVEGWCLGFEPLVSEEAVQRALRLLGEHDVTTKAAMHPGTRAHSNTVGRPKLIPQRWRGRFAGAWQEDGKCGGGADDWTKRFLAEVMWMNEQLTLYATSWWPLIRCWVILTPDSQAIPDVAPLEQIYTWRLQQERHAIAARCTGVSAEGLGFSSDEAVYRFVDRFMPAYLLYSPCLSPIRDETMESRMRTPCDHCLTLHLAPDRSMVRFERGIKQFP